MKKYEIYDRNKISLIWKYYFIIFSIFNLVWNEQNKYRENIETEIYRSLFNI